MRHSERLFRQIRRTPSSHYSCCHMLQCVPIVRWGRCSKDSVVSIVEYRQFHSHWTKSKCPLPVCLQHLRQRQSESSSWDRRQRCCFPVPTGVRRSAGVSPNSVLRSCHSHSARSTRRCSTCSGS